MEYDKILGDLLGRDEYLVVGKSVVRTDALDKCLGRARFTADSPSRAAGPMRPARLWSGT
jgi:hypothetical protein